MDYAEYLTVVLLEEIFLDCTEIVLPICINIDGLINIKKFRQSILVNSYLYRFASYQ